MNRVGFDATLDDIADVNMRLARNTGAYRRDLSQFQWATGVVVVGVVAVLMARVPTGLVVVFSVLCGCLAGFLSGRFYGRFVRRSYVRMVTEWYRGTGTIPCAFELREDVLWTKTGSTEVSFPWSHCIEVRDTDDSVELWFTPGLAVVRNRAFRSADDRRAFLENARSFSLGGGAAVEQISEAEKPG